MTLLIQQRHNTKEDMRKIGESSIFEMKKLAFGFILICSQLLGFAIDPRYHTYDETVAELDSIAANYPTITRLDTIGVSTRDSLPILAMKISDNPQLDEDEPALLFNGIHHSEELLGCEVCLYLLNDLVNRYASDTLIHRWIDESEIWIVPMLNPEGHGIVMTGVDTIWRKNKRDNNNNGFFDLDSDGVDLNRNYDFNWNLGGSGDMTSEDYRGPSPFSENETRGIRDLAGQDRFVFDICYHCVRTGQGELVYYPWRWGVGFCRDYPFIVKIADTVAAKIENDAHNGTYATIYGYATEGTARNWLYGICGTFAFTIEVSRRCYPPGNLVDSICIRNLPGAYYLLERTFGSSITGIVTDSATNLPLVAEVRLPAYYDTILPPRTSDSLYGRYRRIVNAGTYAVQFLKNGYEAVSFDSVVVQPGILTVLNVKMKPLAITEGDNLKAESGKLEVYPNPFHEKIKINFEIPQLEMHSFLTVKSEMSLKIYNALGRQVKSFNLPSAYSPDLAPRSGAGLLPSDITWSGSDETGRMLPAGVYFIWLAIDNQKLINKVILLR